MRTLSRLVKGLRGPAGRNLVKVSIYSVVCLAVLAALVGRIGNIDWFAKTTSYSATMPDATGLLVNDEVKIAGVGVGKVTGVKVERGQAVVSFQIDPDIDLTTTTEVGVRWRNVLGQKYLYLYPGKGGKSLEKGDRLPPEQSVRSADVGEFLDSVAPILQAIDPAKANAFIRGLNEALDGNEDTVRGLLDDASTIATELGGADAEVGTLIEDLDTVVGGLADRNDDLDTALTGFQDLAATLADNNEDLMALVENFAEVSTQLNTLVSENSDDLDATIGDLTGIAEVLSQHHDDLDTALATLPQGLKVYDAISSYGQWFQIRATFTCLANQTICVNEGATADLLNGGELPSLATVAGFALMGATP